MTTDTDTDAIVCHCTCTTRAQIEFLQQQGHRSLEAIAYMTGASAGCGACATWIEELIQSAPPG